MSSVLPARSYVLSVAAENTETQQLCPDTTLRSQFSLSSLLAVTTLEAPPSSPVLSIADASETGSENITITWQPPAMSNGEIVAYALEYAPSPMLPLADCQSASQESLQMLFNNLTAEGSFNVASPSGEFTPKEPVTTYLVKIDASTLAGQGSVSGFGCTFSAEQLPSEPTNVTMSSTDGRTIDFSWEPPVSARGTIIGYQIQYCAVVLEATIDPQPPPCVQCDNCAEAGSGPQTQQRQSFGLVADLGRCQGEPIQTLDVLDALEAELSNAPPGRRIFATVHARNGAGLGEGGTAKFVETCIAPPLFSPSTLTVMAVEDQNQTQDVRLVSVTWTPLSDADANGPVEYFVTAEISSSQTTQVGTTTIAKDVTGNSTVFELERFTSYDIDIQAVSSAMCCLRGPVRSSTFVTAPGRPLSSPAGVSVRSMGTSIDVSWDPLDLEETPVRQVLVYEIS